MSLNAQILDDLKTAMKAKDSNALNVLRALKSALKYSAIEKHGADGELEEADAVAVVRKQIKQRQDSIESYQQGGRDDLIQTEEAEIKVLDKYLPAALGEDEVAKLIDESIAEAGATSRKEMGAVMKILQEKVAGRADNKALSQGVMQKLGG